MFQPLNTIEENKVTLVVSKKDSNLDFQCQCKELLQTSGETSLCSDYSNSRGDSQKIVAVSYYGNADIENLKKLSDAVLKLYSGYFLRIYHNLTENDPGFRDLCEMFCVNDHVDVCDAKKLGDYTIQYLFTF